MIRALSEFGKVLRSEQTDNEWSHDALKQEMISMELVINIDGGFQQFNPIEDIATPAEAIAAKKGKARLLLDKAEEVLCFGGEKSQKKHQLFLAKIEDYKSLPELTPVVAFYFENRINGYEKALENFIGLAGTDDMKGNIGFRITSEGERIHEKKAVLKAVVNNYESKQKEQLAQKTKICSVCGASKYPIEDTPHGMIKSVPDGQSSGCALVSYNEKAFESYGLIGNLNASICTNCAKTYVEGLNWLLNNGVEFQNQKGKNDIRYTNRWPKTRSASFGSDTAMVFWTRNNRKIESIEQLDNPEPGEVRKMIDSLASGAMRDSRYVDTEQFYSCTLSGAAARIAVRDWIETSLGDFKMSIANWFNDISIGRYDKNHEKIQTVYTSLYALARSCQRQRQKNDGNYEYDKDDSSTARVAAALWNAALKNSSIPLWILTKTLARARLSKRGVSAERAALIKIILNRNKMGGGFMITENMAKGERPVAYVCGQIFAKLESIQYAALGKEVNAGIREKYFTYALTTPAAAFGRLFNLSSKHFTKLKSEKPGLAVNLDKELQALCKDVNIQSFPPFFQLEEQGQFAIGYYHQKQSQFASSKNQGGSNDE